MGGIQCKNCGHQITESFRFEMFSSEEEMRIARLKRPIKWIHIAKTFRVKAFPTGIICDAMYYGNACMHLHNKVTSTEQKPLGCNCQNPEIDKALEEFCYFCDKPLYDIMPSQGIDMADHLEWHKQNPKVKS